MIKELKEGLFIPLGGFGFLCGMIFLYYFRGEEPKNWESIFVLSIIFIGMLFLLMFVYAIGTHFNKQEG